jgi:hypothetical protein
MAPARRGAAGARRPVAILRGILLPLALAFGLVSPARGHQAAAGAPSSAPFVDTLSIGASELWVAGRRIEGPRIPVRFDGLSVRFGPDGPSVPAYSPITLPDSAIMVTYGRVPGFVERVRKGRSPQEALVFYNEERDSLMIAAGTVMREVGADSAFGLLRSSPLVEQVGETTILFKGLAIRQALWLARWAKPTREGRRFTCEDRARRMITRIKTIAGTAGDARILFVTKAAFIESFEGDAAGRVRSQIAYLEAGGDIAHLPEGPYNASSPAMQEIDEAIRRK